MLLPGAAGPRGRAHHDAGQRPVPCPNVLIQLLIVRIQLPASPMWPGAAGPCRRVHHDAVVFAYPLWPGAAIVLIVLIVDRPN